MKILITDVATDAGGTRMVGFDSAVGSARARWAGQTAPTPGEEQHVEFDVPPLGAGAFLRASPDVAIGRLRMESETCLIRGTIESVDENGVACLRLADCIIAVEAGANVAPGQCIELTVRPSEFVAFPINY